MFCHQDYEELYREKHLGKALEQIDKEICKINKRLDALEKLVKKDEGKQ